MCQFNYLTLPVSADTSGVRSIVRGFGKNLDLAAEQPIGALLSRGEALFATCTNQCDCGSSVGFALCRAEAANDLDAEAHKLAAKGWSTSKIERWRQDKASAQTRDEARRRELGRVNPEAQIWCELIAACVKEGHANRVGLVHTWEGSGTQEMKQLFRSSELRLDALTPDFILNLERFHLCRFRAK